MSGKGVDAGTRALMLSGAFGGLLGSVEPDRSCRACNAYLHRQRWDEGFVTAVHVVIDLTTGEYVVESAGHPPAVQFDAGSGTWRVSSAKGVVARRRPRPALRARARRCSAAATRCCSTPTAWSRRPAATSTPASTGCSARPSGCMPNGFREGAEELVAEMAAGRDDDCALVLIWRK